MSRTQIRMTIMTSAVTNGGAANYLWENEVQELMEEGLVIVKNEFAVTATDEGRARWLARKV